ncbi:hypothetical protein [Frankia gtarii]|uniref:hypothetical protein n=1 Tax=Frankia gtarii TaxID=2950102 RepID=UPI0021C1BADA|nr:hypothetical protein [Frankia gtarii]
MGTETNPALRYAGAPDHLIYTVAAVVNGLPALVDHLDEGGCPTPCDRTVLRAEVSGSRRKITSVLDQCHGAVDRRRGGRDRGDNANIKTWSYFPTGPRAPACWGFDWLIRSVW